MATNLLDGERALVAGGGIGRGIAQALKAEGATVLGSDIKAPPAEDGIDFLAGDLGQRGRESAAVRIRHADIGQRGNLGRHDRRQPARGLLLRARSAGTWSSAAPGAASC